MDIGGSFEDHFLLVEFAYNDRYQEGIQMAPYKAPYGRPCRSPLCWMQAGVNKIVKHTSGEGMGKVTLLDRRYFTRPCRQLKLPKKTQNRPRRRFEPKATYNPIQGLSISHQVGHRHSLTP